MTNPLVLFFATVVSLWAAGHALLSKRDSKSALAWIGVCILVPIVGPILYLLFGINRITTRARKSFRSISIRRPDEYISEPVGTTFRPMSLVGEQVTGFGLASCQSIRLLQNGEQLYPAMLEAIRAATNHIYLATYIFQHDETGILFADELARARDRGVEVRIIIDDLGAKLYKPGIVRALRKRHLAYRLFNPITLFPPALHINMRNHRKILTVDGSTAFTGGQNIGDRHLAEKPDNPHCAMDLHFQIEGKIVDDLERAFLKDWIQCGKANEEVLFQPNNENNAESLTWARMVLDGPNENLDKLNAVLIGVFSAAKHRIWIMTPYFLPGPEILSALYAARIRGVDVRILLPERTNIHMAHWAAQHTLPYILNRNLEVYLQPPPFIHTKAILIDDNYALIGSANLDPRSLRLNFELGVEVFSTAFNTEL